MKKILILSCNTGEGHNSAARAISGFLKAKDIECEVLDTLSLVGTAVSKSVSDLYLYSTRTNLFKYLYKIGGAVSDSIKTKSIIYAWNWMYSEKLLSYINSGGYDAVICVHCGIPREKLHPFGIPVDSSFLTSSPKSAARKEVAQTLIPGIPQEHNWFLVMTGSMGFGNTHGLINEITRQTDGNTETIVVCGRNEDMLDRIRKENAGNPSVHPIGFTDKIPLLMDACDVLFTKPGGISSTEAMQKHIPLIHTAPIPGCETRNAEFFHYHGMSYSSTDMAQQVRTAIRLCKDTEYRNKMTCAQTANANPDTCKNIISLLEEAPLQVTSDAKAARLRSAML